MMMWLYRSIAIGTVGLSLYGCGQASDPPQETNWGSAPLGDYEALTQDAPDNDSLPNEMKADYPYPKQHFELMEFQSPVRNQGGRGVCSIFSTVALMEHLYLTAGHGNLDFSEQFLQWSAKFNEQAYPYTSGSSPEANLRAISHHGLPLEADWPYESNPWGAREDAACGKVSCTRGSDCETGSCKNKVCEAPTRCHTNGEPPESARQAKAYFLNEGRYLSTRSIKDHIQFKKTAVVVGLDFFYQAWNHRGSPLPVNSDNWAQGYVLTPNAKDIEESHKKRAGHSVLIVGWDDELTVARRDEDGAIMRDAEGEPIVDKGFYLFKNSWGTTSFGIKNPQGPGYGWISKAHVEAHGSAARVTDLPAGPEGAEPSTKEASFAGSVEHGEMIVHSVPVGSGATKIKVELSGTGDADLYTRFDLAPTTASYNCRPYLGGSTERCEHTSAEGESLEIGIYGWADVPSTYVLKVSWQQAAATN